MAELLFFTGTMDSGKSTLALQTNHNHAARGRVGRHLHLPRPRRRGDAVQPARPAADARRGARLTSTSGATSVDALTSGARIDYLICDEAQFYTPSQIDQLARIVDELQIDVFAFGILTDFRTKLFPGSARLVELADRIEVLQVEALCWCGKRATHNARTEDGVMVTEGEVIVVGDVDAPSPPTRRRGRLRGAVPPAPPPPPHRGPGAGRVDDQRPAAVRLSDPRPRRYGSRMVARIMLWSEGKMPLTRIERGSKSSDHLVRGHLAAGCWRRRSRCRCRSCVAPS